MTLSLVKAYRPAWLRADAIAGITLWGLAVPEAIAYSGIAGMPPQAGLYTLLVGLVVYAILGSSRQLAPGATSATAVLLASTVLALKPTSGVEYLTLAAAVVVTVGVLFLFAAVARLGFIAQFLSRPVTEGFIVGLAIFVAVGQLHFLFGVRRTQGNVPERLFHLAKSLPNSDRLTILISAIALLVLFALPKLSSKIPVGLIVIAAAIGLSELLNLEAKGILVVGELPTGLPDPGIPKIELSEMWAALPAAAGIMLLGYSEALAVAEDLGRKHGYKVDPNRELGAYGISNVASGFLGGMVVCGGLSATAVNDRAGAKTRVSLIIGAIATLLTLVVLAPVFTALPEAVLASLIIFAASRLIRPDKLLAIGRVRRSEMWLGILATAGVVFIGVLQGLVIAVVASVLMLVYRASRPHIAELGEEDDGRLSNIARHPEAETTPGMLVLRLSTPIYYVNATTIRNRIQDMVEAAEPPIRTIVLDSEAQYELDITSLEALEETLDWLEGRGITVHVVRPHAKAMGVLDRSGMTERLGPGAIVRTLPEAIADAKADLDQPAEG